MSLWLGSQTDWHPWAGLSYLLMYSSPSQLRSLLGENSHGTQISSHFLSIQGHLSIHLSLDSLSSGFESCSSCVPNHLARPRAILHGSACHCLLPCTRQSRVPWPRFCSQGDFPFTTLYQEFPREGLSSWSGACTTHRLQQLLAFWEKLRETFSGSGYPGVPPITLSSPMKKPVFFREFGKG